MNSLRARVLLLVAGFGLLTAIALAMVMHESVRSYYNNVLYHRGGEFLERVVEMNPDLWSMYESDRAGFSERLSNYTLYSPNTGMYLLDTEGRVLATSGKVQPHWDRFRVDLRPLIDSWDVDPTMPMWGDDPDTPGRGCIVSARPVTQDGRIRGWFYLVSRSTDLGAQIPALVKSYAIRTAVKVGLLVLAIGVLLTMATVAILTKPLVGLTRIAEQVKQSGFSEEISEQLFPHACRNDEIGRLSRTFREMVQRLRLEMDRVKETDSKRREMVASVSHDLRTPLTVLIGQLETMKMKHGEICEADRAKFLESALLNAQHLKRLTEALAELAKLDNPDFATQPEPIAIGELADDVVQRYAARAADAGIRLGVDYPDGLPITRVDAGLIERALSNLIDNALRVTPRGGEIRVGVRRDADLIRLEVSDTGPGVADEDRPWVFERFYQASHHRETRGASGLGLAIVKRVAELHDGQVGLDSEPGHGATFFLALPLRA